MRLLTRFVVRALLLVILCGTAGAVLATTSGAAGNSSVLGSSSAITANAKSTVANPYSDVVLPKGTKESSLGSLYKAVQAGLVTKATIDPTNDWVFYASGGTKFAATFVDGSGSSLSTFLIGHGVNVTIGTPTLALKSGSAGGTLFALLFLGAGALFFVAVQRRRRTRDLALVGSPAEGAKGRKVNNGQVEIPETRFSDVAGNDEAVADMAEYVAFLLHPEKFEAVGATMPKGALLTGPPGCGKTLLARAVAGESGVPFFAVSGSDFVEMYVGVGAKRVRALFAKARKHERAIIFIDEIDAIGRKRSDSVGGSNQESDQTLNALLTAMDGFHESKIIVLGATNRPDILDPALLRPGRLDRRVEVVTPDRRGREKILAVHCAKKPAIADDVSLEALARRTPGMSGAELARVVNEACITAANADALSVTSKHFDAAVELVAMGRARVSAIVTPKDRLVTAWHEAGHTTCAYVLDAADKPVSVSIIPRGQAGGLTWMAASDEQFLTRSKASARLTVALGGRAAEMMLLHDDFTQGAYGDLMTATQLATAMALQYGMTSAGLTVHDPARLGTDKATRVDGVVEDLLASSLDAATSALKSHETFFLAVVEKLLDLDTLSAVELDEIYQSIEHPAPKIAAALLEPFSRAKVSNTGESAVQVRYRAPSPRRALRETSRTRELVAAVKRRRDSLGRTRLTEGL